MFFSIVTPCFNSTETLYRTFESLQNQTCKDFEWILVDDCSTDEGATQELIKQIQKEADFPVKYHFSEINNYTVTAMSIACEMGIGEYQVGLGHDDMLFPHSLERAKNILLQYDNEDVAGMLGRCLNEKGELHGEPFKKDFQIVPEFPFRIKEGVMRQLYRFTKRKIMLEYYQYAERGVGGHMLINFKISKKYKYIFTNESFKTYDTSVTTSITNNKPKYPKAMAKNILLILDEGILPLVRYQPIWVFRSMSRVFYLMLEYKFYFDLRIVKSWLARFLFIPTFIFGLLIYLKRKIR